MPSWRLGDKDVLFLHNYISKDCLPGLSERKSVLGDRNLHLKGAEK